MCQTDVIFVVCPGIRTQGIRKGSSDSYRSDTEYSDKNCTLRLDVYTSTYTRPVADSRWGQRFQHVLFRT